MAKQIEVGAFVEVKGVEAFGGVVAAIRDDQVNVVFDDGEYGWFAKDRVIVEPEITIEAEGVLVVEFGAELDDVRKARVLAKLATYEVIGTTNRRAVVHADGVVTFEVWTRVKDYGGIEFEGHDVYRWVVQMIGGA